MDKREKEKIVYGCFRCGTMSIAPDDMIRPAYCESCGSEVLLTHTEALDMLNDLFVREKFKPKVTIEESDYYYSTE